MQILDRVVKEVRGKTEFKQCTNTREVINWFNGIKNKSRLKIIIFDIENFYPSITPTLLNKALQWAMKYVKLTPQEKKIIHQASQSFLYSEGVPWVKKGEVNFYMVSRPAKFLDCTCSARSQACTPYCTEMTDFTPPAPPPGRA